MAQKKALIYCRTAYPGRDALEMQKEYLLAYAAEQGFAVAGVVSESGSGLDDSREGLREVLALVEDGEVDILLLKSLCRLGRSIGKTDALLCWLKTRDIKVVCADGTEPQATLEIVNSLCQHYHLACLASL